MASKTASSDGDVFCTSHQGEPIQMYCTNCDQAVCLKCVVSIHRGHNFDMIQDVVQEKRIDLLKYLKQYKSLISSLDEAVNDILKNRGTYTQQMDKIYKEVNIKRQEWKQKIDQIADDITDELRAVSDSDLQELTEREERLVKQRKTMAQFIKRCQEITESKNNMGVMDIIPQLKEQVESYLPCETTEVIYPPHFTHSKVDETFFKDIFGRVVKKGEEEENASDFEGESHNSKHYIIDTSSVKNVKPGKPCTAVAPTDEDNAWVGYKYQDREIMCINRGGQVLKTVDLGYIPGDITMTSTGEIIITDMKGRKINKHNKDGTFAKTITETSPFTPQGISTTLTDEILVCLQMTGSDGKVLRLTETGKETQTIQYVKYYYLFRDPNLVVENVNGDVCVTNKRKSLTVVNKDGGFRFRYPYVANTKYSNIVLGEITGIVCDASGNILLSDWTNHTIHLVDINGQFIQYLMTESDGLKRPWGLRITPKGSLWICCDNGDTIKVVKYNS